MNPGPEADRVLLARSDPLPDEAVVTIIACDSDETFTVPPDLESDLLESMAEAVRGEFIPANDLLQRLRGNA